jgi:hypothetical protein
MRRRPRRLRSRVLRHRFAFINVAVINAIASASFFIRILSWLTPVRFLSRCRCSKVSMTPFHVLLRGLR